MRLLTTDGKGVTNEEVRVRTGQHSMDDILSERRLRWLGHVIRMNHQHDRLALHWKVPGFKRGPGRPRTNWRSTVNKDLLRMGITWEEVEVTAQNRSGWRRSVAQYIHFGCGLNRGHQGHTQYGMRDDSLTPRVIHGTLYSADSNRKSYRSKTSESNRVKLIFLIIGYCWHCPGPAGAALMPQRILRTIWSGLYDLRATAIDKTLG